jgi:CheY-like chemotaxis protein
MPTRDGSAFKLLCDEPHSDAGDALGFDAISQDLVDVILRAGDQTPLVIGIHGSWGSGKSSLMRQIERQLEARQQSDDRLKIKTVWFNAWAAERGDVLGGLVKAALLKLDTNVLRRAMRNKNLVGGIRIVVTLAAGWFRVAPFVDAIWERAAADARTRNAARELIASAMNEWLDKATVPGSRMIVVFVDDLDRCEPATVFAIFEAAKIYLGTRGFVFVIGYDDSVISEAILQQKNYAKTVTSRDYLDKIIQIVYRIPDPSIKQIHSLLRSYSRDSGTATLLDQTSRELVVQGNRRNPRGLKRFINAFVLEHRLNPASARLKPKILINTLILQMYFPEFTRLFSERARGGLDPIQEFIDYLDVRQMLSGNQERDEQRIARFLRDHDVQPDADLDVKKLDSEIVDESFARLATNRDFVTIVRNLKRQSEDESKGSELQSRLEEAAASIEASDLPRSPEPPPTGQGGPFEGLRILWIDDNPNGNVSLIERLTKQGALVSTAESGEEAEQLLVAGGIDILISDAARAGNPEAGFNDASRFRDSGAYSGPVIFYVGRITTRHRERAAQLRARITTNPGELLSELTSLATRTRLEKPAVPA